jgi:integrase
MPYLSPPTLTREEQRALLEASAGHPRDHLVFSMALGTGLRLGELVGLNVGDVFFPDGRPKSRIRLRAEIAKGGRSADVFLPSALLGKLKAFWTYKLARRERLDPSSPLYCNQGRRRISKRRVQVVFRAWQVIAGFRAALPAPRTPALCRAPDYAESAANPGRIPGSLGNDSRHNRRLLRGARN